MLLAIKFKKVYRPLFTLLFISLLLGCNQISKNVRSSTGHSLQGEIYSQLIIPEGSEVTLSISPMASSENSLLSYQLHTKEESKSINFKINLFDEIINHTKPLGISVRIEKNGELVMMSNKLTVIPRNLSEKVTLPVISTK